MHVELKIKTISFMPKLKGGDEIVLIRGEDLYASENLLPVEGFTERTRLPSGFELIKQLEKEEEKVTGL